jgi:cytochrome P450
LGEPVSFDPYSYEIHEDPYPIYRRLREESPVYHNVERGFFALSRHADVLAGFRDSEAFSNRHGVSLDGDAWNPSAENAMSFLAMDPPRHTRMRALVSRGFTPRRVAELEPRIRELARAHLETLLARGSGDFIADFAGKLPMDVISELLGVPEADRAELRAWADAVVHRDEGVPGIPHSAQVAVGRIFNYFTAHIEARKQSPRDDLTDALLAAEIGGDRLSEREVLGFLFLMIIAGNETTTKLLGNAVYWLWRNPGQRALVREDPARIPRWVEETLRYDNSTQALSRYVARDVELHGTKLREGDKLVLLIGSANRDERVFPEPDRFDLRRDTSASLAFGQGNHFCLGAALARLEGRVALEELQRRAPDWEIDPAGIARVHSVNVRGFAALPIRMRR